MRRWTRLKSPAGIDWPEGISVAAIDALESRRTYLGQMDLNVNEPLVWAFYQETLKKLASYGAKIVRLDAFAYASKIAGRRNFFNEPETWDMLERLRGMAAQEGLMLCRRFTRDLCRADLCRDRAARLHDLRLLSAGLCCWMRWRPAPAR
jgi:hypothetical protein